MRGRCGLSPAFRSVSTLAEVGRADLFCTGSTLGSDGVVAVAEGAAFADAQQAAPGDDRAERVGDFAPVRLADEPGE